MAAEILTKAFSNPDAPRAHTPRCRCRCASHLHAVPDSPRALSTQSLTAVHCPLQVASSLNSVVCAKSTGRLGITFTNSADGHVICSALIENSVAAQAGLCVGDQVLSINGEVIKSHQQAKAVVDAAPEVVVFKTSVPSYRSVLKPCSPSTQRMNKSRFGSRFGRGIHQEANWVDICATGI